MALPKHKVSKSKGAKRRTHKKIEAISIATCPDCGEPRLPHHACGSCGSYKGRTAVPAQEE